MTVVVQGPDSRLPTRELLYTAVTRARQRVTMMGTEDAVRAAVTRRVRRASGLGAEESTEPGDGVRPRDDADG